MSTLVILYVVKQNAGPRSSSQQGKKRLFVTQLLSIRRLHGRWILSGLKV